MKVETAVHGDVTVLTLSGELNADSVARFQAAVADASSAERRDFLVDLRRVTQVDSVGLETLTALQRQAEERLGLLRLCGADATIRKVLEITRLDKQLALHETREEALDSFTG